MTKSRPGNRRVKQIGIPGNFTRASKGSGMHRTFGVNIADFNSLQGKRKIVNVRGKEIQVEDLRNGKPDRRVKEEEQRKGQRRTGQKGAVLPHPAGGRLIRMTRKDFDALTHEPPTPNKRQSGPSGMIDFFDRRQSERRNGKKRPHRKTDN